MNQSLIFIIGTVLTILPGILLLSVSSSSLVLAMGGLEILLALAGSYLSTRTGNKNPVKFLSVLPVIFLIALSQGYVTKLTHLTDSMSRASTNLLVVTLFLWEFGICSLLAYESSGNLQKQLSESGYDEVEWRNQTGRMTDFMLGITSVSFVSSYLIYLLIVATPKLNINPLFALIFFGILYLVVTRFYSSSRKK